MLTFVLACSISAYSESASKYKNADTKVSVFYMLSGNSPFSSGAIWLGSDSTGQAKCSTPTNGFTCSRTVELSSVQTGSQTFYAQTVLGSINVADGKCGCYLYDKNGDIDFNQPCKDTVPGKWSNYDPKNGGWSCQFNWVKPSVPFSLYGGVRFQAG